MRINDVDLALLRPPLCLNNAQKLLHKLGNFYLAENSKRQRFLPHNMLGSRFQAPLYQPESQKYLKYSLKSGMSSSIISDSVNRLSDSSGSEVLHDCDLVMATD
jgi:hypothetical protein